MIASELPPTTILIQNIQDIVPIYSYLGLPLHKAYDFSSIFAVLNEKNGSYDYYGSTTITVYNSATLTDLREWYANDWTYCNCADCCDLGKYA